MKKISEFIFTRAATAKAAAESVKPAATAASKISTC